MKTPLPAVAFLLAAFLSPTFLADSQQPLVGSIQGIVRDPRGVPLPDVSLTATNIDAVEPENRRHTTGTDRSGFFEFVELAEGRFSIVIQRKGYRDYTIPEVTVRGGESVKLPDIRMSPL
jgi:hypothetical protein